MAQTEINDGGLRLHELSRSIVTTQQREIAP
jgi:hypothetical protein